MLDIQQATAVVNKNLPGGSIQSVVTWQKFYVFQVFRDEPGEEEMDPFFSVDQETGEFKDWCIFRDGNPQEVAALFMKAKGG